MNKKEIIKIVHKLSNYRYHVTQELSIKSILQPHEIIG